MTTTPLSHKEQITWAIEEGAGYIIAETFSRLEEAKLALQCILEYGNGGYTFSTKQFIFMNFSFHFRPELLSNYFF